MDQELKTYLDGKFASIDGKFTAMDGKFTAMDGKFTAMDGKITAMDGKITAMDGRFTAMDGKIAAMDGRFVEMENRLIEKMRDMQTELLRGFESFSTAQTIRLRKLEADQSNLDTSLRGRVDVLETRLTQIELRLGKHIM
jgi:hypothetical protein